ncbi:MAG TPA: glycosyltransferase family 39 protein [Thermoanaerobaculia bacterium]|nr:glycosyltransferase family 39 protein [Thermoanaerobaculia bacterium]
MDSSVTSHPTDATRTPRWISVALAAVLLASFAVRTWDASFGLYAGRHFDERFTFKNVSAILKHGEYKPRHAFYLSLSYLPQTAVMAASDALYRVTGYPTFSIFGESRDGNSATAYWLARMVNVVYGTLSLWVLFLIGRRLYSPEVGLLAAAVLASVPRHLTSSTEFKPDILVILLTLVTFHWTLSAASRPTLGRFLRVGLDVGLAVSTKYTGIAAAIPITAAVLRNGWRDRRQWLWLVLAGVTSILTFLVLNPFLGVVFQFIPILVKGYADKGVTEKSNHWVVFERQVDFLIRNHGPVVALFLLLGIVGLLWRIYRPAAEDDEERRLGSMLVLSILLGYSVIHSLGMTLFRSQNYLPVVPFSSLAAAWAMMETWRLLSLRAPRLSWQPLAALLGIGVCGALVAQEASVVYYRVVPTSFSAVNGSLLSGLESPGLRHLVFESSLGRFDWGEKSRRPLLSPVDRLARQSPRFLDLADVEVFPGRQIQGPDAAFYRGRLDRVAKSQIETVDRRFLRRRGEAVTVVRHPWALESELEVDLARPPGSPPFLVGRLPVGRFQPGDILSVEVVVPKSAADEDLYTVRLGPGDRTIPLGDTGRHRNRFFRTTPRFELAGGESEMRIAAAPLDAPDDFRLTIYRWRPAAPAAASP